MKAILMSIKPKYVAKILNGKKTIEIRKKFPKDYVGWVYIYCTKDRKKDLYLNHTVAKTFPTIGSHYSNSVHFRYAYFSDYESQDLLEKKQNEFLRECCETNIVGGNLDFESPYDETNYKLTGKVVARFWCDKVEETHIYVKNHEDNALLKNSCLTVNEFMNYLGNKPYGYAIHVTKLEIFDKPREISEFRKIGYRKIVNTPNQVKNKNYLDEYLMALKKYQLTRAPQSWCYVEV